jgi:hypothetical protein
MNKRELALLEKAFAGEIDAALSRHGIDLIQTKSKLAAKLVEDGLLARGEMTLSGWPPLTIKGYRLTEAGRMAYCMTCGDDDPEIA